MTSEASAAGEGRLALRIFSALVLAPLTAAAVYAGSFWFAGLLAVAALIMAHEFMGLMKLDFHQSFALTALNGLMAMGLILTARGETPIGFWYGLTVLWASGLVTLGLMGRHRLLLWAGAAIVYVWLPIYSFFWLRTVDGGAAFVMWAYLLVWGTDVGAYAVGRYVQGPKLLPAISPNKTWAGLLGGIILALLATWLMWLVARPAALGLMLILTPALAVWSQIGDMLESAIKRYWGAKDTGRIIPGHGGLMDRVDGLVTAAPLLAFFVYVDGLSLGW